MRTPSHWVLITVALVASACGGSDKPASSAADSDLGQAGESNTSTGNRSPSGGSGGSALPDKRSLLENPETREATIIDLIQESDQVAANGTKTDPALAFIDRYAGPLAQAYEDGHSKLSSETRNKLINLLVSFDDERTSRAHARAIHHYAETGENVDEAIWACRAAQRLKNKQLQDALLQGFKSIDMSDKDGRRYGTHLQAAMVHNQTSAWSNVLRERLEQPLERPARFNDKPAVRKFQNQRFWQSTAARLLGDMDDRRAARPLLKALLTQSKRDIHDQARLSLLKLGRPSIEAAIGLLDGSDEQLVELSAQGVETKEPHVFVAAELLKDFAAPASAEALIEAWKNTKRPRSRVAIARALAFLPKSEESIELFKKTYNTTRLKVSLPNGESALEALGESLVYFFDTDFVPWLNDRIPRVPGAGARKGDVQRTLVMSLSQLVLEHQLKKANRVARKFGGRTGTPAFNQAKELIGICANKPDCYLKQIDSEQNQAEEREAVAIKSAIMVGMLGQDKHRDALIALLPKLKSRVVLVAVSHVISHMTPNPSKEVLSALRQITEEGKDGRTSHTQRPIEELWYRLRAR